MMILFFILVAGCGLLDVTFAQKKTESDSLFLCTEETNTQNGKMVYGYIDGEKTECMSEHELLSLLHQTSLRQSHISTTQEKEKQTPPCTRDKFDLRNARMPMADLMGASLDDVCMNSAELSNADLRYASLTNANLRNANLSRAYCKGADFTGANLTGANMKGAYLNEANFTEAEGLTFEMLKSAQSLHAAKLPPELTARVQEELPEKLEKPREGWINNRWDL